MIRIYILEDDPSIIHNLTQIITSEKLGIICGDSADGMPSTAEILATRPDVIMLDFFMPQRDGIEVVTDLRAQGCTAKCIMLSQVSEKTLIGKAYSAGVDFFISKPINLLEVRGVIRNASCQVENERTLANIRSMFSSTSGAQPAPPSDETQRLRRVHIAFQGYGSILAQQSLSIQAWQKKWTLRCVGKFIFYRRLILRGSRRQGQLGFFLRSALAGAQRHHAQKAKRYFPFFHTFTPSSHPVSCVKGTVQRSPSRQSRSTLPSQLMVCPSWASSVAVMV